MSPPSAKSHPFTACNNPISYNWNDLTSCYDIIQIRTAADTASGSKDPTPV